MRKNELDLHTMKAVAALLLLRLACAWSLAPKLQRVSLGGPAATAPWRRGVGARVARAPAPQYMPRARRWYAETFGVAAEGAEVVFGDGFRLRFDAGGPAPGEFGCIGVGVEVADAESLAAAAGAAAVERWEWFACMVPDEVPEMVALLDVAALEDPGGRAVIASRAASDGAPAPSSPAPKVVLTVSDLPASVEFYTTALGMTLLRKRALLPHAAAMSAWVGFSDDDAGPEAGASGAARLELRYCYNNERVDPDVAIGVVADPAACAVRAPLAGGSVAAETAATATLVDPDGYTVTVAADAAALA